MEAPAELATQLFLSVRGFVRQCSAWRHSVVLTRGAVRCDVASRSGSVANETRAQKHYPRPRRSLDLMRVSRHERMRWRSQAAFFIFVIFFAVFGVIVLMELLLLERSPLPGSARRFADELQVNFKSSKLLVLWITSVDSYIFINK